MEKLPQPAVMRLVRTVCVYAAFACGSATSWAEVNLSYLEGTQPVAPDAIATLGPDLFGDKVNLFNGALEFEQTDTSLPGNSALSMALTRRYTAGRSDFVRGQFGDWDLDVPKIGGTFTSIAGWVTSQGGTNRCSGFSMPPLVSTGRVGFIASDYWQGTNLSVPGHGTQEVLSRVPAFAQAPQDGLSYSMVTRDNVHIGCLATIQNGPGEGFFATTPYGIRYRFDWLATRTQTGVKKNGANIARTDYFLLATEATDRFGNWVRYSYEPSNPLLLRRMESSDGRVIQITNVGGRAVVVSDGTRTFQHHYNAIGDLSSIVQPDGSQWTFNLRGMTAIDLTDMGEGATCDFPGALPSDDLVGTMTHPSGATGTFTTRFVYLGRTYVDRYCKFAPNSHYTIGAVYPRIFGSQALINKSIAGPGVQPLQWSYSYGSTWGWNPCTNCSDRRVVRVTAPDGAITAHQFGTRWRVNEGQLLQTDEGWTGTSWLRTTTYRYRVVVDRNQAFADQFGVSLLPHGDYLTSRNRPQDQRVITQQDTTFTWQVEPSSIGFDVFARPLRVNLFSSQGTLRTEITSYHDNLPRWVLGQKARVFELSNSTEIERHTYDAQSALKSASYSFGRLINRFEHRTDGTLATLYDAADRPISFQNFMRGKPQYALFADGTSASRVVNNLGHAVSETNEVGTTTSYGFDAMGRVASVAYPTGDAVAYAPTLQSFTQVWTNEYGLAPGHWRQTVSTGQGYRHRYFDALWRLRLEHRFDAADPGSTQSFIETRYDPDSRKSFQSYPSRQFTQLDQSIPGVATTYDALDRVTQQRADSELGVLTTTNEYLTGFVRQVTNPRRFVTQTRFQVFDTPSEDRIASIRLADSSSININRDLFGKPWSITRSGSTPGGLQQATRSYVYDPHQRLCKTIEPETAATVQAYDAAGNMAWRASGQALPSGACDTASVPEAAKIRFGYDARDRLTSTTYGDGSPSVQRSYNADGLLRELVSYNTRWIYSYNNRRQLIREQYAWEFNAPPDAGWRLDWGVNANGHVQSLTDAWGAMNYQPNALGQATQVSGYATQVRYHPNGSVAGYRLDNGVVCHRPPYRSQSVIGM
jgi:YD repeat-containing protein